MTNLFQKIMCFVGFHNWVIVASTRPTRACVCCGQKQQLCRGAGGDDWMNIN